MQAENALTQGYLMFGLDTQLLELDTRYTDTNIDCKVLKFDVIFEITFNGEKKRDLVKF